MVVREGTLPQLHPWKHRPIRAPDSPQFIPEVRIGDKVEGESLQPFPSTHQCYNFSRFNFPTDAKAPAGRFQGEIVRRPPKSLPQPCPVRLDHAKTVCMTIRRVCLQPSRDLLLS
jgi:hypothetical protein